MAVKGKWVVVRVNEATGEREDAAKASKSVAGIAYHYTVRKESK